MNMNHLMRTAILLPFLLAVAAVPVLPAQNQPGPRGQNQQQAAPLQGPQWHEPHGRFTITIPAGWHIDDSQPAMKITNGSSWAIFDTTSLAGGPLAVAQRDAAQMQSMVGNWKVVNQGNFTAGQNAAAGITVTCDVPTKTGSSPRVMLFLAMAAGNDNYATMTSSVDAPTGEQANSTLAQIFQSIRF